MKYSDIDLSNIVSLLANRVAVKRYYFDKLPKDLRALAFTVSNLETIREIEMVKRSLANAIDQGQSFKSWRDNLNIEGIKNLSNARLENVYRTNINTVYNQSARLNAYESGVTPYMMYTAVGDERTRPEHMALNGTIKPVNSEFWDKYSPPISFNCTASYQNVSGKFNKAFRSFYKGDMVRIKTKGNKFLSLTLNHPVATTNGFIAAKLLQPQMKILVQDSKVDLCDHISGKVNNNNSASASNAFKSMFLKALGFTKSSSFNFYGDIQFMDKKVDVVTCDGFLSSNSKFRQAVENLIFKLPDNIIRNILFSLLRKASSIKTNILFFKKYFYITFRNIKSISDFSSALKFLFVESFGLAFYIFNIFSKKFLISYIPWFKATRNQSSIDSISTNAELLAKFKNTCSAFKSSDEVVDVKFYPYFGFVYDFESLHGLVITDDLVTSNCRCGTIPLDEETAKEMGVNRQPMKSFPEPEFGERKMGDVLNSVNKTTERAIDSLPKNSPYRQKFKEAQDNIKNLVDVWFNKNKDIFNP